MKRNLILSIAVAVCMMAATVAQAADVSFSGEFRPRFNIDTDTSDDTSAAHFSILVFA
jgi:Ni/Co efflux regulator RcnB